MVGTVIPEWNLPVYFSVSYLYNNCNHTVLIVKACFGESLENKIFRAVVFLESFMKPFP